MRHVDNGSTNRLVVIGGGIIGLCIAWEAHRRGRDVVVLDAGPDEVSASRGNAGQIAPGHPPIPSPAVPARALHLLLDRRSPLYIPPRASLPLARWLIEFLAACRPSAYASSMAAIGRLSAVSRDGYDRLAEDVGAATTLNAGGIADFWLTDAGQRDAEAETAWMAKLGFNTSSLTGEELRSADPAWGPDVRGAVLHVDGMTTDPAALCDALRVFLSDRGIHIVPRTCVTRLHRRRGGWLVETARGDDVHGHQMVIAAGAWTPPLAAQLGVSVRMQPAKGYHITAAPKRPPRIAGVLREHKIAVTPLEGQVRIAGTLELSGFNFRKDDARVRQLIRGSAAFLPELRHCKHSTAWAGLRPCTPHGLPVIRPAAQDAWIAAGHGMMGLTLGPGTASLVLDGLHGNPLPDWAAAFTGPRGSRSRGR